MVHGTRKDYSWIHNWVHLCFFGQWLLYCPWLHRRIVWTRRQLMLYGTREDCSRIRYRVHLCFLRLVTLVVSSVTSRCPIYFSVFACVIFYYFTLCVYAPIIFTRPRLFSRSRSAIILCRIRSFWQAFVFVFTFSSAVRHILCCVHWLRPLYTLSSPLYSRLRWRAIIIH